MSSNVEADASVRLIINNVRQCRSTRYKNQGNAILATRKKKRNIIKRRKAMQSIENLNVKEKMYIEKMKNGLTVIIVPKENTNKKHI